MPLVYFFCGEVQPFYLVVMVVYAQTLVISHYCFAAFFLSCLNMLTFFKGLSLTSPISASVIMVSTPNDCTCTISHYHEGTTKKRMVSIPLGLVGTDSDSLW
jgi:hypothetical protein